MKKLSKLMTMFLFLGILGNRFGLELSVPRSYSSAEAAKARIWAPAAGKLFFRIYRISDPEAFLAGQKSAHYMKLKSRRVHAGPIPLWKSLGENFKWSLHQAARRYMTTESRETLREAIGLKKYLYPFNDRYPDTNMFAPKKYPLKKSWELNLPQDKHWYSDDIELPKLQVGFYLLEVSQGRSIAFVPVVISDLGILVKEGRNSRLIYSFNLATGQPMEKATVSIYDNPYGKKKTRKKIQTLTTSKNGVVYQPNQNGKAPDRLLYVAKKGNHYALSDLYYYGRSSRFTLRSAIYSERPVYRQGNTVQFKGYVFQSTPSGRLKIPRGQSKVTILDPARKKVFERNISLNEFGSFSGTLQLNKEAPLGYYQIQFRSGESLANGNFYVEQYKKPDFKVNVSTASKVTFAGDSNDIYIKAMYYTGDPVTKGTIEYSLERRKLHYPYWWDYAYSWYYSGSRGSYGWQFVEEKTLSLDKTGTAMRRKKMPQKLSEDYEYRVTARVTGITDETITGRHKWKVVRSNISLRQSQKRWYYETNDEIDLTVHAQDWENKKKINLDITADLYKKYYVRKKKNGYWKSDFIAKLTAKTDKNGTAFFKFPKQKADGGYEIRVSTKDEKGRESINVHDFYVYNPWSDDSGIQSESLSISMDKTKYEEGEKATLLITGPMQNGPVLIVEEAEDVLGYHFANAKNSSAKIGIDLDERHYPNTRFYVHSYKKKKGALVSLSGFTDVIVPPARKFLKLKIESEKETYKPGEVGTFRIHATDYKGRPVKANFSLGVVDEAIYAIRSPSFTELARKIYPLRNYSVYSAESLYFYFHHNGKEEKLYSRLASKRETILAQFKEAKQEPVVRKNFKDTAYWIANGETNGKGVSTIKVKFPDNLTQWRFTVHAVDKSANVGSLISKKIVKKDFAIRLSMPRFIRESDELALSAVVQNTYNKSLASDIRIKLNGLELVGNAKKRINIAAKSEAKVEIKVKANELPKSQRASVRVDAIAGSIDSDAVKRWIPILPYGNKEVVVATALFRGKEKQKKMSLSLPANARKEGKKLKVSLVTGTLPAIVESLPYLIGYPYGCLEQTLSRFIPLLQARKLANEFKFTIPVSDAKVMEYTNAGIEKVVNYQQSNGAWGWWGDNDINLYMTSYALEGLALAKTLDVPVKDYVISKGLKALVSAMKKDASDYDKVYAYYVLSLHKNFIQKSKLVRSSINIQKLKKESLGFWNKKLREYKNKNPYLLAFIAHGANNYGNRTTRNKALAAIVSMKKKDAQGTYFESKKRGYYWYNDREESTAMVLRALALNKSAFKKEAPNIVLWLLLSKRESRWRSTKSTARIITALAEYARFSNEKLEKFSVNFSGKGISQKISVDPKKPDQYSRIIDVSENSLDMTIRTNHKGLLLVRSDWEYLEDKKVISPKKTIFTVERNFHKLIPQGKGRYVLSKLPTDTFKVGDLLASVVEVNGVTGSKFFLLEDNLPSGMQVLEKDEKITLNDLAYQWYNQPSGLDRFDDRIARSRSWFQKTTWRTLTLMRANREGVFNVVPARGGLMYYPETNARSGSKFLTVQK